MEYSRKMSASRSISPVEGAKNRTRQPRSTSVRASATATCMLPWKFMGARLGMRRSSAPTSNSRSATALNPLTAVWSSSQRR